MSFIRCSHPAILILSTTFALTLPAQRPSAAISDSAQPVQQEPPPSHGAYPQIVRLSLVQGDVRLARGKQDEKLTGDTWEQAAVNTPLQTGFNLVTGKGRAEIEFEDASTLYLDEDSALSFNNLTTKNGVPHTAMTLLSGTVTLHLRPTLPGELYVLRTPTHAIVTSYGERSYLRLTSYLNGMKVTPQISENFLLNRSTQQSAIKDKTYIYTGRGVAVEPPSAASPSLAAWDHWVSGRIAARAAAMHAVMKQSGLNEPLPGLADIENQGAFFACAPYGTCWQPAHGWASEPPPHNQPHLEQASLASPDAMQASPQSVAQSLTLSHSTGTAKTRRRSASLPAAYDIYDDFPCLPGSLWYLRDQYVSYGYVDSSYPYDWVVCHTGSWLYRQHGYVWVVGRRKHHRCPIRWVRYKGKLAYVPLHPRDRVGRPPANLRHGIFAFADKSGRSIERLQVDAKSPPKLLDSTPKEFRSPAVPLLARAETPQLEAHFIHNASFAARGLTNAPHSVALTFDRRSQGFLLATRITRGGRTTTLTEPFSNRGGRISSPGPVRGGYSGGSRSFSGSPGRSYGGGSRGGFSGGGSGGSRGSFSGGGGGGSRGGFSGGGGSASSSSSSSSGSHR